jgi:hypothetical protein
MRRLGDPKLLQGFDRITTQIYRKRGRVARTPDDFGASKQAKFNSLALAQWAYDPGTSPDPL